MHSQLITIIIKRISSLDRVTCVGVNSFMSWYVDHSGPFLPEFWPDLVKYNSVACPMISVKLNNAFA